MLKLIIAVIEKLQMFPKLIDTKVNFDDNENIMFLCLIYEQLFLLSFCSVSGVYIIEDSCSCVMHFSPSWMLLVLHSKLKRKTESDY